MHPGASEQAVAFIEQELVRHNVRSERIVGEKQTVLAIIGPKNGFDVTTLAFHVGVQDVIRISPQYHLSSRTVKREDTVIQFPGGIEIGGTSPSVVIAGPCSVESADQLRRTAELIRSHGCRFLRGGAFKPRTSPNSFQGMGAEGLELLRRVADEFELFIVTEVMEPAHVAIVAEYAHILQVGTRNMFNYPLLRQLGTSPRAVLLKRGFAATVEEWLMAAEYILNEGNSQVILCERGIRTFEQSTRNTLDLSAVPTVKKLSHLPIIVDPSHATGQRDKVLPLARAALAAGADGVMVEVHPAPEQARSDGSQALTPELFHTMMEELKRIGEAIYRPVLSSSAKTELKLHKTA